MPNSNEIFAEIQIEVNKKQSLINEAQRLSPLDIVRKKYLEAIYKKTNRNVIAYYSGWLQKPSQEHSHINDKDKNAFMAVAHRLDRSKGLDLILHTPGGDLAATESIVDYLHSLFNNDIRAIIPQISMSAGTMIALSCKSVVMGRQSNLGPIDPQFGGIACQAVLDEFDQAKDDIKANPHSAHLWREIISKYHPTFLIACRQAIDWSEEIVEKWLERNMFNGNNAEAKKVKDQFASHKDQKNHARHISIDNCKKFGLIVEDMEADQDFQDLILSVHHTYMHTFENSPTLKIVENHLGATIVEKIKENK